MVLAGIEKGKCTHLELVPAALIQLLSEETFGDYDLSSVKIISTGGQRLQPETSMLAEEKFPNGTVQEVFGMAEGLLMYNDLDDPPDVRHLTAGKPVSDGDEVKLIDDAGKEVPDGETGEMACRGPYTLRGYYKAPEVNAMSFTEDGFYLSGDIMRMHSSGNVIVEGRIKDLINRGGEKISAEEVENMIIAHPSVNNVACVPMPDPVLGERTCAYVIPATGQVPDLEEIKAFLTKQGIAKFKFPERLEIVDAFPLSPFGKVSKKDLAEMIAKKIEAGE
jgi:2,3-dihydroxybenzoate-AMP ligase